MAPPNPGSNAAIALGCTCPVLDNARGLGAYGGAKGKDDKPMFWVSAGCPVHSTPSLTLSPLLKQGDSFHCPTLTSGTGLH